MTPEQKEQLQLLDKFHCVVATLRFDGAFRANPPLREVPPASDDDVFQRMAPFREAHPVVQTTPAEASGPKVILREEHKQFLVAVLADPFKWFSYYINKLMWGASKGCRVRDQLETHGFLKAHDINIHIRGGNCVGIEPLLPAYQALNIEPPDNHIKGKFIHRWHCHRVKDFIGRMLPGQQVFFEKQLRGKAVDVAIEDIGGTGFLAYEIQLDCRVQLIRELLIRDLQAQFVHITLCVPQKEDLGKVEAVIAELASNPDLFGCAANIRKKVSAKLLSEFL